MASQLVIHDNNEVGEVIMQMLERALGTEANVEAASNFERAWRTVSRADKNWSLVVMGSSVPKTATAAGNPADIEAAWDFLVRLREQSPVPVIVLDVTGDPGLGRLLRQWEFSELVRYDELPGIENIAKNLHSGFRPPSGVELRIFVQNSDSGRWDIIRKGKGSHGDVLSVPQDAFNELIKSSEKVGKSLDDWQERMEELSDKLFKMLFNGNNEKLQKDFFLDLAEVGGAKNARIVFTMSAERQAAMVDALRAGSPGEDFWMLQTPIVREYDSSGSWPPLYSDKASRNRSINCLVISANPEAGKIENETWRGDFPKLPEARSEAEAVHEMLKPLEGKPGGIGKLQWIDFATERDAFKNKLLDTIKGGQWDMVHFAGHGTLDAKGLGAGLVLDAPLGLVLGFKELIEVLKGNRFLFVSSCRSAKTEFISNAMRYNLPAVLGYRWPVADLSASQFARAFYKNLFLKDTPAYKSLEYTFLEARRAVRSLNDYTWASSMLLTSMSQLPGTH